MRRALTLPIWKRNSSREIDVPSRAMQNDWLSVKIETELELFRVSSTHPIDICMVLRTFSKEHMKAAPYPFSVIMMVIEM